MRVLRHWVDLNAGIAARRETRATFASGINQ